MTAVEPPGDDTSNDASSNALPDTTTKRKILNYLNKRNCGGYTYLFLFISIIVISVIGITIHDKVTVPVEFTSNNVKGQDNLSAASPSDTHCIRHTPKAFLDEMPDNIDSYCKPVHYKTGSPIGMTVCDQKARTFIFNECLCDVAIQCDQFDRRSKVKCSTCRDKNNCPCQNNGTCNECQREAGIVTCICPNGTTGTYCTKISKRLCHRANNPEDILGLSGCNVTNDKSCMSIEYSTSYLVCELTEFLIQYPNCSAMGENGRTEFQKTEEVNTKDKYMFVAILIISAVGVCIVIINLCKARRK